MPQPTDLKSGKIRQYHDRPDTSLDDWRDFATAGVGALVYYVDIGRPIEARVLEHGIIINDTSGLRILWHDNSTSVERTHSNMLSDNICTSLEDVDILMKAQQRI